MNEARPQAAAGPVSASPPGSTGFLAITQRHYWLVLHSALKGALAVHAGLALLFAAVGVSLLAWANLAAVGACGLALRWLRGRQHGWSLLLMWAEVILMTALAVRTVGWDTGFHYYLLIFVPLIFINATRDIALKWLLTAFLALAAIGLDLWQRGATPTHPLNPDVSNVLHYANLGVTFVLLGWLSHRYLAIVGDAESRLHSAAVTDALTGLANRRQILDMATREEGRRQQTGRPLSFIMADLDDFKRVNDHHGHEAGDAALAAAAECMRSNVRGQDCVSRWGGEEFLAVLPEADEHDAAVVAERIRQALAALAVRHGAAQIALTATFGVAEMREGESISACIARADEALYHGKRAGKNCVVVATALAQA